MLELSGRCPEGNPRQRPYQTTVAESPMPDSTKTCIHCGYTLPLSSFYVHKQMADGHLNSCKACQKARVRANRRKRIEYYRQYEHRRAKQPRRVAAQTKLTKSWRLKHPDRYAAHAAVSNAIRDGVLKKPSQCSRCASTKHIHGHHEDYSRPLDVIWLCPRCHRIAHQR